MENKKFVATLIVASIAGVVLSILLNMPSGETPSTTVEVSSNTITDIATTTPVEESVTPVTPPASTLSKPATTPKTTTAKPASAVNTVVSTGKLAPEVKFASGYTNTDPVLMKDLIGKQVVLVNFWTTTSIASIRTIPYLNQLHQKYKHKGLVILSVHTPQFVFEREKDNVDKLATSYNMQYPILHDNQSVIWNAWGNKDWPTQYLVDINGRIVYTHKGEGDYQTIETKIQEQLAIRSATLKLPAEKYGAFETPAGAIAVDLASIGTNQTYFGAARNGTLANGIALKEGLQNMNTISTIELNKVYLSGSWNFTKEVASAAIEGQKITFMYKAKSAYAVLSSGKLNKVEVLLDGQSLGANAGKDVILENGKSYIYVNSKRMYDIVKGDSYGVHTLELIIPNSGLDAYMLSFG